MTRVLITGAGGFCGRHFTRYLTAQGVEVHPLSLLSSDTRQRLTLGAVDVAMLSSIIQEARPHYIFHLAGVAVSDNPAVFYLVNSAYAATLLRALEVTGYQDCPVLLVGTAAEYGMISAEQLPISEERHPLPYNDYGVSKLAQTLLGLAAARRDRPIVVARPFNIIGPAMPPHLVLQSFASQIVRIIRGEISPVLHVGNLESARDFIDVEEVVQIYWKLIQTPPAYGEVVNVCSGAPVKIRAALDALLTMAGVHIDVQVDPVRLKAVDVPVHYGSRLKLQQLIGETEAIPLALSLERIFAAMLHA
jgi:GDP-4-dehydro-6-deoxy-D-mannose reductase